MFIISVLFSLLIGKMASNKDRSFFGWFLLSCFISPIFAGLILMTLKHNNLKKCYKCAEEIKVDAVKCRHCGHSFEIKETVTDAPIASFYK
jgi:ribosomal protein L40E